MSLESGTMSTVGGLSKELSEGDLFEVAQMMRHAAEAKKQARMQEEMRVASEGSMHMPLHRMFGLAMQTLSIRQVISMGFPWRSNYLEGLRLTIAMTVATGPEERTSEALEALRLYVPSE